MFASVCYLVGSGQVSKVSQVRGKDVDLVTGQVVTWNPAEGHRLSPGGAAERSPPPADGDAAQAATSPPCPAPPRRRRCLRTDGIWSVAKQLLILEIFKSSRAALTCCIRLRKQNRIRTEADWFIWCIYSWSCIFQTLYCGWSVSFMSFQAYSRFLCSFQVLLQHERIYLL